MRKRITIALLGLTVLLFGATSGNIQWTQLASSARHGSTGTKGQSSDGTGTSGHCVSFDANGNVTDAGAACGTGTGTVTSIATTSPITGGTITTTGNIACATCTVTVGSGTIALTTSSISSGACSSASTVTISGTASTDAVVATLNADPTGTTGYAPSASGSLYIWTYPTANTVNAKVCNPTSGAVTPGAATLNVRVVR